MPSFDTVSEVDLPEVTNAVDQTNREIGNRFDFKGSGAKVEQESEQITLIADSEFQLNQMKDILHQKLAKRGIDLGSLEAGKVDAKLHQIMRSIHEACVKHGTKADGSIDYVKGANVAGFLKVANAMIDLGIL